MAFIHLPDAPDSVAPDGAAVRVLLHVGGCSMAHFQWAPGQTSAAVRHRTVDELWFVLSGNGELWLSSSGVVPVRAGDCIGIPVGTGFQVRTIGPSHLQVLGATCPPWPGDAEAVPANGPWEPACPP